MCNDYSGCDHVTAKWLSEPEEQYFECILKKKCPTYAFRQIGEEGSSYTFYIRRMYFHECRSIHVCNI